MDSLSSSDVVHTIGTHPNDLFRPTGGTVDDTPIFLLDLNVHCLSLICANYKIRFNFKFQLLTLKVIVAQIDNLAEGIGRLVVSLTPPAYPTAPLPSPGHHPPNVEAFLEVYPNNASEPTFRLKEALEDFYFELESGYAIDISFQKDVALIISAMLPYNSGTEMTELAAQLILNLQHSEPQFNVSKENSNETISES
ncbi:hypothetical protein ACQ4M3_00485 [Leptolyngbya sp. AN03gr2]|uniref:hypothetical protein n=1 Tax=unclassified Leptolyngbya TaxID=2650499 RepID=UPI003D30F2DD